MFVVYSICNIKGITNVNDTDFIEADKNYLQIQGAKISVEDFMKCEQLESVNYVLPGNSIINLKMRFDDYYQTSGYTYSFEGSLSSIDLISNIDIKTGRINHNKYEIILDKMIYNKMIEDETFGTKYMGIKKEEELLGKKVFVDNMEEFTIVGFVDEGSPSIYVDKSMFINLLNNTNTNDIFQSILYITGDGKAEKQKVFDYNLHLDDISITKGRLPENDYEVIINEKNKNDIMLNKDIDIKVNNTNLKVVGYYNSKINMQEYLVNNNTVKYYLINQSMPTTKYKQNDYRYNVANLVRQDVIAMIYPNDKEKALDTISNEFNLRIKDKYESDKLENTEKRKEVITSTITFACLNLIISLIENYLIIRASFLSRIKEIRSIKSNRC